MLADIISEAKMANAIVLEVLEFVRPIRLQVDRTSIAAGGARTPSPWPSARSPRGATRLDVDVPQDLPAIQGDHHQLCQVVTNLLINAFEALGGHGRACASARRMKPAAARRASRRDGRAGHRATTARAFRPRSPTAIFNPFFTTKPQGSGLGLAIVRKIVDAHDGRIDVTTGAGQGTRVHGHAARSAGRADGAGCRLAVGAD